MTLNVGMSLLCDLAVFWVWPIGKSEAQIVCLKCVRQMTCWSSRRRNTTLLRMNGVCCAKWSCLDCMQRFSFRKSATFAFLIQMYCTDTINRGMKSIFGLYIGEPTLELEETSAASRTCTLDGQLIACGKDRTGRLNEHHVGIDCGRLDAAQTHLTWLVWLVSHDGFIRIETHFSRLQSRKRYHWKWGILLNVHQSLWAFCDNVIVEQLSFETICVWKQNVAILFRTWFNILCLWPKHFWRIFKRWIVPRTCVDEKFMNEWHASFRSNEYLHSETHDYILLRRSLVWGCHCKLYFLCNHPGKNKNCHRKCSWLLVAKLQVSIQSLRNEITESVRSVLFQLKKEL